MKCRFIKSDESTCQANAMKDSEFCYLHNPAITDDEKKEAQAKGGRANSITITEPLPPVKITDHKDVLHLITDTINQVRAGRLDTKIANSLGVLSSQALKAIELGELEGRLETIERLVVERKTTSR